MLHADWLFFSSFDPFLCECKRINRTDRAAFESVPVDTRMQRYIYFFIIIKYAAIVSNNEMYAEDKQIITDIFKDSQFFSIYDFIDTLFLLKTSKIDIAIDYILTIARRNQISNTEVYAVGKYINKITFDSSGESFYSVIDNPSSDSCNEVLHICINKR